MKIRKLFNYAWLLLLIAAPMCLRAQTTVSVNCTGSANSFQSGSVNSAGVLIDGDFTPALSNNVRGWAVFDLASASIPTGSTITSVSLFFNKSAATGSGSFSGNIKAVNSDLSTLAIANQGATVYSTINAGTTVNSATWSNGTGTKTLNLTAAGISFVQSNTSNIVSMCWSVTASTRLFTITGYGGTASTQPKLTITYLPPCTGTPSAGTAGASVSSVCANTGFTLSLTGATTGGGISYQWQSSPAGQNTWTNIAGATNTSYNYPGISANTDFRAYVVCAGSSASDTTTVPATVTLLPSSLPEDFSSGSVPPCGWSLNEGSSYVYYSSTSAFGTGTGSATFDFYSLDPGNEPTPNADLITFVFTPPVAGTILSFDEAYATYSIGNPIDNLNIDVSTDGGANYTTLTTFTGGPTGTLNTGGSISGQFTPSSSQWQNKQIILPGGINRIRFRGVSAYGNNLYIDNVQFLAPPSCFFPSALTATNITSSSADISWTNVGSAPQFRIEYGPTGFTPGTGTFILVSANSYSFTSLTPNTAYSYYVRAICSAIDSSGQTGPFNFVTPCVATNVPYTENFDGAVSPAIPSCLVVQDANNDASSWYTATNNYVSAPNSMTYTTNFNFVTPGNDWFFTPAINMNAGTSYSITFKYASSGATEKLEVKAGTGANAAAMGGTALFSQTNISNTSFITTTVTYTPSVSGPQYFGWHCFSSAGEDELYVDDISIDLTPSCQTPTVLTATNVTTNGVSIGWTNNSTATQFRIEYGPLGFTPGTGTFVLATSNPFAISGLSSGTAYACYVRALCSATDSSSQAGPLAFTTPCIATSVPYTENFDGVVAPAVPVCIAIQDVNADGTTWHTNDYSYTSAPNGMTYTYNSNNDGDDWFFTQGINMNAGTTYIVSFKYASDGFFSEKLEVKNGTSPNAAAMGSALFSNANILNSSFNTASFYYTPSVSGVQYFGWHCFSDADQDELYVDDLSIDLAPTCVPVTALTASNLTSSSAELGWTNPGTATQFRIEYGPTGFTPGTGTFVLATTNPFTINTLTPGTGYSFYVRALCSATDSSAQTGPYNFSTPCLAINVPYVENFDGVSSPTIPSCIIVEDVNQDNTTWQTATNSSSSGPNSMTYEYNSSTPGNDWFYTPGINMTAGTAYIISFKYASAGFDENLEVKTGTSPSNTAMTGSALFSQSNITSGTYTTATINYTPLTSGVQYFGWHCFSDPDEFRLYVDDISIDLAPTCPAPTALTTANLTPTSVDLGWTNNSSATQFRVEYGPTGFTPGTGTFVLATSNPFTISGLTANTAYSYYVRALCSAIDSSSQTGPKNFSTLIANDIPAGAIALTVGAGCIGLPYTNSGATNSTGEPFPSCRGTAGFHSVWYSFMAPPSGFVRVTNDYSGATIGNSRIGVFSTPDANNLSAFTILACDDNNAPTTANKSLLYVNGLTPGTVYYVEVDGVGSGQAQGTFCLTVDEVTSSMLATTAACAAGHAQANKNTAYNGWISLVDASGNLIANVRQTNSGTTSPTAYASAVNINTGAVRQNNGLYYLDRNYLISATGTTASQSFDVQFYFLNTELTALQGVDATATAPGLNVTRQANNTCQANFATANGARTILVQTGNSSANGVTGVQVMTPGFSNFYIHAGIVPLVIRLDAISGVNVGTRNRVDWSTASEESGDAFVVQRSIDGSNFTDIGSVNGHGKASTYSFWDERPVAGVNHYRLKLTDATGASSFSNTVDINVAASNNFTVEAFPNPAKDMVTVKLYGTPGANPQVTLTDVTGKHVMITEITGESTTIDIHGLVPGFYLIKYSDGTNSQVIKLNKE